MIAARTGALWLAGLFSGFLLVAGTATAEAVEPDLVWRDPTAFGVIPAIRTPRGQVVADLLQARDRWRPAAEAGDPIAQHNLAVAYGSGPAPLRNERAAAGWYRRAALQGFVPAQINLGRQYWLGLGVARDLDAAAGWWRAAAVQGSDAAALNLVLLIEGIWNPPLPQFNAQSLPRPFAPPRPARASVDRRAQEQWWIDSADGWNSSVSTEPLAAAVDRAIATTATNVAFVAALPHVSR